MRMDLYQGNRFSGAACWDKRKGASAPEVSQFPPWFQQGGIFIWRKSYALCNFRPEYAEAVYSSGPS